MLMMNQTHILEIKLRSNIQTLFLNQKLHFSTMANVFGMSTQSKVASRVNIVFFQIYCLQICSLCGQSLLAQWNFLYILFSTSSFLMQNRNDTFYPSAVHSLVVLRIVVYVFDAAATIVLLEHGKIVLIYLVYGITKVHLLFTILLWWNEIYLNKKSLAEK